MVITQNGTEVSVVGHSHGKSVSYCFRRIFGLYCLHSTYKLAKYNTLTIQSVIGVKDGVYILYYYSCRIVGTSSCCKNTRSSSSNSKANNINNSGSSSSCSSSNTSVRAEAILGTSWHYPTRNKRPLHRKNISNTSRHACPILYHVYIQLHTLLRQISQHYSTVDPVSYSKSIRFTYATPYRRCSPDTINITLIPAVIL